MGSKHHGSGDFRHHDEQPKENGHEREHCGQHLCRCQSQTDQSSGQKGACHDRHGEQLESEMTDPSQHHEHGHHEHGHHEHGHHEHGHHEHGHHEHGHHEHGHHEHGHEGVATAQAGFRRKDAFGAWRANREPGFGRGKVLFFDAFSGVAGDMIVAALVDLGVPQEVVERAVQSLRLPGCELRFQHGYVGSIGALKFDVEVGAGQNERDYATIDRMLLAGELDPAVSSIARTIFRRLAEAEAAVHRTEIDAVHFHEVGAVDSIADIVGAAACIEYIGASVWCSPLPMGRGFIQCRHGKIPLPAPATVQCLSGISTRDAGIEAELVTPTGAAILGALSERCVAWPEFTPNAVGWGAGTRVLPDRPNVLRVVLGEPTGEQHCHDDAAGHVVIEANVDDATGELAGHALGLLLDEGALDAWAVPITMKKGRPGVVLSAIVAPGDEARLTALLIRETTTLGVRRHLAGRTVRPRRMIDVSTQYGTIPVKVSEGPFGPPQIKPEFDVCVQRARDLNLPVREVISCAASAARRVLALDGPMEPFEQSR